MRTDISEDEAIRTIVGEGTCPDFVDVANLVQQRFGLRVGSARVEQVARAMQQEAQESPPKKLKRVDVGLAGALGRDITPVSTETPEPAAAPAESAASAEARQDVLKFVESMGGFDGARAAITNLENSLRHLMK